MASCEVQRSALSTEYLHRKCRDFWGRRGMALQNKRKDEKEEELRLPSEVLEVCRIMAGILRRTPQVSSVDVEGTHDKSGDKCDISEGNEN